LAGIAPFLENLKRNHRKHPPAGFTYLEQKRWTLLEQAKQAIRAKPVRRQQPRGQGHRRAVRHRRQNRFLPQGRLPVASSTGASTITPQLLALADIKPREEWRALTRQQAGAWNSFIRERVGELAFAPIGRRRVRAETMAAKKDGTWSPEGQTAQR
jgi:hypothetical protein